MSYDDPQLVADLKALLKARKRSARSVSQAIGVPYRSMQNYLSGESRMPATVLIKTLDELGSDIRRLRHGDNLLRHADIFDAVYKVFGDYLGRIPLDGIGARATWPDERSMTPEAMTAHARRGETATELAVRLSEAYDAFVRDQRAPGHMPTIKELRGADHRKPQPETGEAPVVGE